MFRNIIKTSLRYLVKNKSYTFVNLSGLTLGIATSLLIFLFIQDELSYDTFHENAAQTFRLEPHNYYNGEESRWAATQAANYLFIKDKYPEIKSCTRVYQWFLPVVMRYEDLSFSEDNFDFADSTFFKIFSFDFIDGNPNTALDAPDKIVLTESTAKKYFGETDPLGKQLIADFTTYTVSAVIKDVPKNSHFHFDMLAPMASCKYLWPGVDEARNYGLYTYLLLHSSDMKDALASKLRQDAPEIMGYDREQLGEEFVPGYELRPVKEIHLRSHGEKEMEQNGNMVLLIIFGTVAIFILFIAGINYMNLATAQSTKRSGEVGLRKILGAHKPGIFKQFMAESFVLVFIALVCAYLIIYFLLPWFNGFTNKDLNISLFENIPLFLVSIGILVFIALFSGSYPSVFLANFQALRIIKSDSGSTKSSKSALALRRVLVLFQFTMSVILIIGAIIVFKQLKYINEKDLGFEKEGVVCLELPNDEAIQKQDVLKDEFVKLNAVKSCGLTWEVPGQRVQYNGITFPFLATSDEESGISEDGSLNIRTSTMDEGMLETLGLKMKEGRWFSKEYPTDLTNAYVLNEAAVEEYQIEEPIGKQMFYGSVDNGVEGTIIGVVENYHYASLHNEVEPQFFKAYGRTRYLCVKLQNSGYQQALNQIRASYLEILPGLPFNYFILEELYESMYRTEQNMSIIISFFTLLAVLIAAMGLFGMASFVAAQKTKEIGIRKVLGASVSGIMNMLAKEFLIIVLIANAIAYFPSYYFMQRWLENFAYKTEISVLVFGLSLIISVFIALIVVGFRTYKAASSNPAETLKHE